MNPLVIGNRIAKIPLIQGGMGVGVSLSKLAGAVAKEGAVGIISTAQIGFRKPEFEKNVEQANEEAIKEEIHKAKEIAKGNGLVGVNIMVALKHYVQHVKASIEAGADVIISGAGLPLNLPELTKGTKVKIAPIVSGKKAAQTILKMWDRKYKRTADFLVIEGPKAGGHLGFKKEELDTFTDISYDEEIKNIIDCKKEYEEKYACSIPVIVAGGIFTNADVKHAFSLGADGVQVASRFVATKECDASEAYKEAYLKAKPEDITIIQSPVGMPGRAIENELIKRVKTQKEEIKKCYGCLAKCEPKKVPYCITKALIDAVKGDIDNGLVFCGARTGEITTMTTVTELINELMSE